MCLLTTGIRSEKASSGDFNVVQTSECNLDGSACYTPRLYGTACCSRLQACTTYYSAQPHEIKSNTRQNDAIKIHNKQEMYEVAATITQHTVLQQTSFLSERVRSKVTIKTIVNT